MKRWFIGVLNAAISGVAAAIGSIVAGVTLKQGIVIVAASAGTSMIKWMAQHPIPDGTETKESNV